MIYDLANAEAERIAHETSLLISDALVDHTTTQASSVITGEAVVAACVLGALNGVTGTLHAMGRTGVISEPEMTYRLLMEAAADFWTKLNASRETMQ
jgi:hypothetical protein